MRNNTLQVLTDFIATEVAGTPGNERNARLQALKPELAALRAAYQSSAVQVQYTANCAAAYMLAYFPGYVFMAEDVAAQAVPFIRHVSPLRVAAFGGGPLPELVGVLEALAVAGRLPARVEFTSYDVNDAWRWAAEVSTRLAQRLNPRTDVAVRFVPTDFRLPLPDAVREELWVTNFVTFQNCCNEVTAQKYCASVEAVAAELPVGAVLTMADLIKYDDTRAAVGLIERNLSASGRYSLERAFQPDAPEVFTRYTVPLDVRDNFFDGPAYKDPATGDWAQGQRERKKVRYSYSVLVRRG